MAYYKVSVKRCLNAPKSFVVTANSSQQAVRVAAVELRNEGISDARAIEVIGQVKSLRDG